MDAEPLAQNRTPRYGVAPGPSAAGLFWGLLKTPISVSRIPSLGVQRSLGDIPDVLTGSSQRSQHGYPLDDAGSYASSPAPSRPHGLASLQSATGTAKDTLAGKHVLFDRFC